MTSTRSANFAEAAGSGRDPLILRADSFCAVRRIAAHRRLVHIVVASEDDPPRWLTRKSFPVAYPTTPNRGSSLTQSHHTRYFRYRCAGAGVNYVIVRSIRGKFFKIF